MAFAKVAGFNSTPNKTASSTHDVTITIGGRLIIAVIAFDNLSSGGDFATNDVLSMVLNPAGSNESFTKVHEYTNGQSATAAGATVSVWYLLTSTTGAGHTVRATFVNSVTAKSMQVGVFSLSAGNIINIAGTTQAVADGSSPANADISGLTSREYLFIAACAIEAPAASVTEPNSGYAALASSLGNATSGGGSASNMACVSSYRIGTTTSAGHSSAFTYANADNVYVLGALYESAPPTRTPRAWGLVLD